MTNEHPREGGTTRNAAPRPGGGATALRRGTDERRGGRRDSRWAAVRRARGEDDQRLGRRRERLDQPRVQRPKLLPEFDPEAFGRLSESVARFIGTGRFIVWMTLVIILWVVWNIAAPAHLRFDSYPFIFLTLALSLQASYAAPLILLAQNRQADRDRVTQEQERKQNQRSIADTEYLTREIAALRMGLGEVATRDWIRSELQDMLKELAERHPDGESER